MTELKPLSKKHQRFVAEYLKCFNGTRAYMKVYPKSSYEAAMVSASTLLRNPKISEVIDEHRNMVLMQADEALKLQSDIANGDMGELADENGFFDFGKAKEAGLTKLIRKFKQKTTTFIAKKESEEDREVHELEVELYAADTAQERILKVHGKLVNRTELTGKDGGDLIPPTDNAQVLDRVNQLLELAKQRRKQDAG